MLFKKIIHALFGMCLLLCSVPVFAQFHNNRDFDHIESFYTKMMVSPSGTTTIEETIVLWVGDYAAPHSDKVQKGFIRDLPLRGLAPGYDSIMVEAVSCDEVPVIATVQKSYNAAAIKIQTEQPLQTNKKYTYHLKYRYPGLIHFSNHGSKELTIDWQFTLKYGLPTLKSVGEIFLPQDSSTIGYYLKADTGHQRIQNFYPKNEGDGESVQRFSWSTGSRQLDAERGAHFLRAVVTNDSPSDLPVGLELKFEDPVMHESLLEQYTKEKTVQVVPSSGYLFVTCACMLLSYFFIVKGLQERQKEYQKQYQQIVSQQILQNMPPWQRHYVRHGKIDISLFETFFCDLYQRGIISIDKNKANELTLTLTPEQRQKLSVDERKVIRLFFKNHSDKPDKTWEQSLHLSSDIKYFELNNLFSNLLSKVDDYPKFDSIWLWSAMAASIIGLAFIGRDMSEFFTKNSGLIFITLYCASPVLLTRYVIWPFVESKQKIASNISSTGSVIMVAFLVVFSYLHYLGYYNHFYVCIGMALYILWLFESFFLLRATELYRIAMIEASRLLPAPTSKASNWQEIWALFETFLKHFRDQSTYAYLPSGQRVYLLHRKHHMTAGYRGSSSGGGSSVGGGGGSARGC